jgi:hypothetical protein
LSAGGDAAKDGGLASMTVGILKGQDLAVAAWTWQRFRLKPLFVNRAYGIMVDGKLAGSAIFHDHNGPNVELSYCAEGTLTAGLTRNLARVALDELRVERVTFRIPKNRTRVRRALERLGATFEASLKRYYGSDPRKSTALQYVLFSEQLAKIAGRRPSELN